MKQVFKLGWITFLLCTVLTISSQAQSKDTVPVNPRTAMMQKRASELIFPVIKGSVASGVFPISNPKSKIDSNMDYKLLFDFTVGINAQYQNGMINEGLDEIGRMINLHRAAGVSAKHLKVVIVTHSAAVLSLLNDAAYQAKFKINNPNADIIKQLQSIGATIVACGQTMQFRDIKEEQLIDGVQKAFSARTALSTYLSKGYVPFQIAEQH
ncbi:MAG: DsrE family protein [Chitinophagaceae bacterium]|uniref:DsrE family protein n=1 Tax=unclassified Paraflavitalea TaxID=2798305 RepID=UPI003D339062|nr:DsrE family protein [Chitinophagaceae bacterium]